MKIKDKFGNKHGCSQATISSFFFFFSFLIGNKSFINRKSTNVFTIVNSLHLRRIQTNQREELIELKKSDVVIQCVKPQIRDHSNKVPC